MGEFLRRRNVASGRDEPMTLVRALVIGVFQAVAICPGISRSGSTIAAGLFLGLDAAKAARFSFLLGIPAIAGAGIFELRDALSELWAAQAQL